MSNKKPLKKSTASNSPISMNNAPALKSAASAKVSSNKDTDKKPLNPSELQGLAKVKWSSLQTDLQSALGDWSDLDQKPKAKSPEEEQLEKVKSLIEDLKLKLNDF